MRFRVRQRECRPPRSAEYLPAIDLQMIADTLDVGDESPRRVVLQFCARCRASAPALIEQHDAVMFRIEEAPAFRIASRAGTAVQKHDGFAVRISTLLVIQRV